MLAVSRLQLCSVRSGVLGNRRVRDLDSIVSSVLTQVDTRPTTRFRVDWNTRQRREEIVQSVVLIRTGAVLEFSDLTGEYRTAASEWLKSIHLETTSAFLPRETSIGCRNRRGRSFLVKAVWAVALTEASNILANSDKFLHQAFICSFRLAR
jgi:hypothetical protein